MQDLTAVKLMGNKNSLKSEKCKSELLIDHGIIFRGLEKFYIGVLLCLYHVNSMGI